MNLQIGIIGYGYWGPNLVRNFFSVAGCTVAAVAELRDERINLLKKNYPSVVAVNDAKKIIEDPKIDAVVISTPVFTHFQLAKAAILNGKHVMVEKPMTTTSAQAEELIELAAKHKKVLMVDHTFLYTGAVKKMKSLIEQGTLGNIDYFDSTRINLGLFQPDINVLWDLAPHDIAILSFLIKERPVSVHAVGVSHTSNHIENIAYMILNFNSGMIAHFNCSWSSPVKIRLTLIGGDKKMIVYNDMEPTEKIKIYDTGYEIQNDEDKARMLVDYRTGDVFIPKLETTEALLGVANDFIKAISEGTQPVSNSGLGLSVVKILEASQESIKNKGKEINL